MSTTIAALPTVTVTAAGTDWIELDQTPGGGVSGKASVLAVVSAALLAGPTGNIKLGSNFISNGGTNAGLSLDASNNATLSGNLTAGTVGQIILAGDSTSTGDTYITVRALAGNAAYTKYVKDTGTNKWAVGRGVSDGGDDFHVYDFAGTPGARLTIATSTGNATLSGNLTVSGTGQSSIAGGASVGAANATNATTGYFSIPTSAGAPTGVPAGLSTGTVAIQYDTTNNFLYVYNGGWKKSTVYA